MTDRENIQACHIVRLEGQVAELRAERDTLIEQHLTLCASQRRSPARNGRKSNVANWTMIWNIFGRRPNFILAP